MSTVPLTFRGRERRWRRLALAGAPWAVWATLAAAIGFVLAFDPTDYTPDPTGPCTWHMLFGIDGPSCGGTRMVWYLLHGNLVQAARHHLAALLGTPVALYALIGWTAAATFGRRLPTPRIPRWAWLAYAAFFLIYAVVLRNLPWEPFTWFYVANLT
jgi:hypothetical protein